LIGVLLLLVAPLTLLVENRFSAAVSVFVVCFCGFSFLMTVRLPHAELAKIEELAGTDYLATEKSVLGHLREKGPEARVYFEYLNNYRNFPFLSAHYLDSSLREATGQESFVNSHLQESLPYRYVTATAKSLGANTY